MIGLFAALVLFAQGESAAAPADPPKAQAHPKVEAKHEKMVCHEQAVSGSHLTTTVCRSAQAATDKALDDQAALERLRDRSQAMPH